MHINLMLSVYIFHLYIDIYLRITSYNVCYTKLLRVKNLSEEREFVDSLSELPPTKYTTNNNLEYYYKRNNKVIKYLLKQEWVDKSKIIVAGHSEGSSIAAKIASTNKNITHLIYSGSTIYYPRILSMVNQDRYSETDEDSWVNKDFEYWKNVNENPTDRNNFV